MVQPDTKRLVTVAEEAADIAADRAYVDQAITTAISNLPGSGGTSLANVIWLPDWDGTGTQPTRPPNTDGYRLIWPQPVAPPLDATHAHSTDRWELI